MSSCGIAIWDEGEPLPHVCAKPLCSGIKDRASGFIEAHRLLASIHNERAISLLAVEEPLRLAHDSMAKLISSIGLYAHFESYCQVKLIPMVTYRAELWRETFLGADEKKGKSVSIKKLMAVERAQQYGLDPECNDEAEAFGLLDHLLLDQRIQPPWRMENPFLPTLSLA